LDTKQQIIEAAFELFCEKGYHLSMAELANAVGIKTPSLYSHFSGKDEILELMINKEILRYFDCLNTKLHDAQSMSCKEAMKSLFLYVMEYFSDLRQLRFWRTIPLISNEELRVRCGRLISEKDQSSNDCMRRCFMKGIKSGELRPGISESALGLYLVMIQGILDGMLLFPKVTGENRFAESVYEAYWEGVRAAQ
jgi:AcrR family transcriptional regulator